MTEFKLAERDFDPRDYEPLSVEWDDEIMQAIREEEKAEREKEIADSIEEFMRDIFGLAGDPPKKTVEDFYRKKVKSIHLSGGTLT